MMADILICSEKATFGQPEITLGIIPGGGGTQRLTGLIGKSRTMDMVLANRKINGKEAAEWGLCARAVPAEQSVTEEAVKVAEQIAKFGQVAAIAGKEAVNAGEYASEAEGPMARRRLNACGQLSTAAMFRSFQLLTPQPSSSLSRRVSASSAASSRPSSPPRTRRRVWPPSPRSASLPGRTTKHLHPVHLRGSGCKLLEVKKCIRV